MKVLLLGGSRYFGVHLVHSLLRKGHEVTIATRGIAMDPFDDGVERVIIERTSRDSLAKTFGKCYFDAVCDNLAYCSNDIKALLDSVQCGRYVMTSSVSVYKNLHLNIAEEEFNPLAHPLIWCNRDDYTYDEIKRQAESAIFQQYPQVQSAAVRFPYVIGEDDYTQRLYFYVDQIVKGNPMNIDNLNDQIGFISSTEAGEFLSWVAEQSFVGPINGASAGTISIQEVIHYVEQKTNKKAVYSLEGQNGSYNGAEALSLDVNRANDLGYRFSELKEWVYKLLDNYVSKAMLELEK